MNINKSIIVEQLPSILTLETSTMCNFKCIMCTQSIPNMIIRPSELSIDIIYKLTEIIQNVNTIQLHGIGEPLISKSFWKILEIIPSTAFSSVNTNFSILNMDMIHKLIISNLKHISVSIDAATENTYYKIRGFDFNVIKNNIKRFIEIRNSYNKSVPKITCNMTIMKENINEILQFIQVFGEELKCDSIDTWPLNNFFINNEKFNKYGDCDFIYEEQGPWNFVEYYTKKIIEAKEYAFIKNIKFTYII